MDDFLKGAGYARVPLERNRRNNLIEIAGQLNGQKIVVGIHTGSTLSLVDEQLAKDWPRLSRGQLAGHVAAFHQLLTTDLVGLELLEFAGCKFQNLPANRSRLRDPSEPVSQGVVLGQDFFRQHHALLHPRGGSLFIRSSAPTPETTARTDAVLRRSGYDAVPLMKSRGGLFFVPAKLEKQSVSLALNTMTSCTMLDRERAKSLGIYGGQRL